MDRYSGKVGETIDLFLYIRNSFGVMMNAYSVGQVFIYRNDPDVSGANTIASSVYGSVTLGTSKTRIYDTSLDLTSYDINVGDYVEIALGSNSGYYKILSVSKDNIEIDGEFKATESNISYKVTMLKAILTPVKVSEGKYRVSFFIPDTYDGGYYYDLWKDIQLAPAGSTFDQKQKFYVAKELPYYINEKEDMTDRFMAYQGGIAFLDMEFRSEPNFMPYDPYLIEDVVVYREDPSDPAHPVNPIITSVNGEIDASDNYLFRDTSVDFTSVGGGVKKYDTIVITSPVSVMGRYRVSEVVDANNIKVISPFSAVTTGIIYTIEPYYYLDASTIVKQSTGKYAIEFPVPSDFVEEHYWDAWSYLPGTNVSDVDSMYAYDNPVGYVLSDATEIAVAGSMLHLIMPLPAGHLKRRPYAYHSAPFTLTDPKEVLSISSNILPGSKGEPEYSLLYNGNDIWFDGSEWIPNTGSMVPGDEQWNYLTSIWHMSGDWTDGKRSNDGVRSGTGIEFGASAYLDGTEGLFNGTDDYVSVPYSTSFDMGYSGFTFAFIFNTASVAEQVIAMQAFSNDAATGGPGWVIKTNAAGNLVFGFGTGAQGSSLSELVGSTVINDGNPHVGIITVGNNKNGGDKDISFFIDEVFTDYFLNAGIDGDAFGGFVYDLMIGADYHTGLMDRMFYSGSLQEFAIIKKELSFSEASRLYNNIVQNKHSLKEEAINSALVYLTANDGDTIAPIVYLAEADDRLAAPMDLEDTTLKWNQYSTGPISKAVGDVYVREAVYEAAPGPVNTCTVVGRVVGLDGSPEAGAKITAWGYEKPWEAEGSMVVSGSIEVSTDSGGYFNFNIVQGVKVWLSIPWLNYRKKVTIPYSTRVNWLDLEAEEEL